MAARQASYFFGYMSIVSYAFFIMLGSIGFYSALAFVKHIYGVIKVRLGFIERGVDGFEVTPLPVLHGWMDGCMDGCIDDRGIG